MIAYDPFIEELVMSRYGVRAGDAGRGAVHSDFVSMHAPATPEAQGMLKEKHFRHDEADGLVHQHRPRPDGGRSRR